MNNFVVGFGAGATALALFLVGRNIMASIGELQAAVARIHAAAEMEHEEVAEALDELRAEIAALTAIVQDGGTLEQRQALLDSLTETEAKVASIVDRPIPEVPDPENGDPENGDPEEVEFP